MTMDEMTTVFFQTQIHPIAQTMDEIKAVGRAQGYQGFYMDQKIDEPVVIPNRYMNQNVVYMVMMSTDVVLKYRPLLREVWKKIYGVDSMLCLNEDVLNNLNSKHEFTTLFVGSSQNLENRLKQHIGQMPCLTKQSLCLQKLVELGVNFSEFSVLSHHVDNNKKNLSVYTKLFRLAKRPLFSIKKI